MIYYLSSSYTKGTGLLRLGHPLYLLCNMGAHDLHATRALKVYDNQGLNTCPENEEKLQYAVGSKNTFS